MPVADVDGRPRSGTQAASVTLTTVAPCSTASTIGLASVVVSPGETLAPVGGR